MIDDPPSAIDINLLPLDCSPWAGEIGLQLQGWPEIVRVQMVVEEAYVQ